MKPRFLPLALLATLLAALSALTVQAAPIPVVVSVAPQKYFVEQIAGPLASVTVLASPGADPHSYEPKPSQMAAVAKARIYFAQGVEFEKVWLKKLSSANPGLLIIDTVRDITRMPMAEHEEEHQTGAKDHDENEQDPHVWVSPSLVKIQAQAIANGFAAADPANTATYAANLQAFTARIDALDAQIRTTLAGLPPNAEFLVFHPAWAYFARDYGLKETPIESSGKEPGAKKLQQIITHAKTSGATVIFVQPQFSKKTAQTVADAINATLVEANDMAEDWPGNLLFVAKALRDAVK